MADKKVRKKMSPKAKKIGNIIITSLQVAIVVITVIISVFVWTTTGKGDPSDKTVQMLAIRSNSMAGDNQDNFDAGDLVIIKRAEDTNALTVGTVVTYKYAVAGGATTLVTHRIHEIILPSEEGGIIRYKTKGDNVEDVDAKTIQAGDIIGVYSFKLKGIGSMLLWLQGYEKVELEEGYGWDYSGNSNNFLWVIIIPLIALLLWNGYAMIKVITEGKINKARQEAAAAAAAAGGTANAIIDEEEIKRRAIEEYLAKQQGGAVAQPEQKEDSEAEPEQNSPLAKGGSIADEVGNGGFDNSNAQPELSSEAQQENTPKMATKVDIEGEEKRSEKAQLSTSSREQAKSDSLDDMGVLEDSPEAKPVAKKPAAKTAAAKKPAATTATKTAAKKPASATVKTGTATKAATTAKKPAATKTTAATKTSTAKKPAATKPKE